ncbi:MAG: hypothetical protein ACYTFG_02545 [Planctomycetota bacterium]|jgi:hypothetical protein
MIVPRIVFALAALFLVAQAAGADMPELAEGVKVEAGGAPISAEIGHLVPVVADWNGDGKKDLIVGQFKSGKIRLYTNVGTDSAPKFDDFEYMKAGGEEISLPCG